MSTTDAPILENTGADLLQCIGLADALRLVVKNRNGINGRERRNADHAIMCLADTLSERLCDVESALHEALARSSIKDVLDDYKSEVDPAN